MASFIKELAEWLADSSRLDLTVGNGTDNPGNTPLYVGFRPDNAPDFCNAMYEPGTGTAFFERPKQRWQNVQILTRAHDYHIAREEAERIRDYIHGMAGVDLNSLWWIFGIELSGAPGSIGDDGNGRWEFSANYSFKYEDST